MWIDRCWALKCKVRLRGAKRLRIGFSVALHVLYQWTLSLEAALYLVGKRNRQKAQLMLQTLQTLLLTWMQSEPQSFVHAQIEEEKQKVYVEIKTIGRKGEDGR